MVNINRKKLIKKIFFFILIKTTERLLLILTESKNQDFFNFSFNVFNISRIISKTFITLAITFGKATSLTR